MKTIELKQGLVAQVDDADYSLVAAYKWTAKRVRKNWYAVRADGSSGSVLHVYLHRFLLGFPKTEVDHRDGNGLNCQRGNIRACVSVGDNQRAFKRKMAGASSRFRGVSWDGENKKWRAKIRAEKRTLHLGRFKEEVSAAKAYDVAARRYFGEFAAPNFL